MSNERLPDVVRGEPLDLDAETKLVEAASKALKKRIEVVEKVLSADDDLLFMVNYYDPFEQKSRREVFTSRQEAIKKVGLEGLEWRSPFELSGGQTQRLAIATVLALKPEVLVLDEPTTGQDVPRRIKMIKYLKDLTLLGITVILVTHDVELTPYCSRLIVLGNGGVLADGEPREILYNMDLLENAGLKPPQLVRLAIRMQDDTNPVTLDEMAQSILSRLPKAMVET